MQKFLFSALIAALLFACSGPTIKKEKYDNGRIKSEKTYQKIDGKEQLVKEVQYHPNGKKYIEGGFKNELRDGHWVSYYDDGKLWSEGGFVKGESHGKRTVYHPNGKKYYEGSFNMGKRSGVWVFYDENGNKVKEVNYNTKPEVKE
jgi:uncharacterized protein